MIPETFPDATGRVLRLADTPRRQGGQAVVYRAELDGRAVAVKVYDRGFARAQTEHRILDEILRDDPGAGDWLVTVLAAGSVDGRPFLVFPWMESSLADWVPGRSLPERVAVLVAVAEAVARLHRSRRDLTGYRVHRDIKPDNLLVGWEGRWVVRLADLGTAKDGDSLAATTNTGVLTEKFAPPEQALPVDQEPQESWDVHALAVTIFWGLTERIPIPALDAAGLLNAQGRELVHLARRGIHNGQNEAEKIRFQSLRRLRPHELLDLESAAGWSEDDTAHLRRTLEDWDVPEEERERLVALMTRALRSALEPDARLRDNDVRRLISALRGWAHSLPIGVDAGLEDSGHPTAPPSSPRLGAPTDRSHTWSMSAPASAPAGTGRHEATGRRIMATSAIAFALFVGVGTAALAAAALVWAVLPEQGVPLVQEPTPTTAVLPPPAAPPPSATADRVSQPPAPVGRAAPRGPASVVRPSAAVVSGETDKALASVEEAAPVAEQLLPGPAPVPEVVSIRVRACPGEETTASIDHKPYFEVTNLGHNVEVEAGVHTIVWMFGGAEYEKTFDVGARRSFCHAFVNDGACGSCND